jgi:L-cysteine desulfidase
MLDILQSQVAPAIGCTEPVSVAIAVAAAKELLTVPIKSVQVHMSLNIFKNGMRVGIPGTQEKGIMFAVALALVQGSSSDGLEIFKEVDEQAIQEAHKILASDVIRIDAMKMTSDFYISATLRGEQEISECTIMSNHTNIVSLKKNGEELYKAKPCDDTVTDTECRIDRLDDIFSFIERANYQDLLFLLDGVKMNMAMAQEGKENHYSSALGSRLFSLIESGQLSRDVSNLIKAETASACDARMGGARLPVMSSSGSGNQGLAATIPLAVLAEHIGSSTEQLVISLALSHLITHYIKQQTGRLSPVCGCAIAAGIGAAAGMTLLQGGEKEHIHLVINNMIGSLAGMVCDGAKGGCSYKISTAVGEAYTQALVVLDNTSIAKFDGIIGSDVERTITNLAILSRQGMGEVDSLLVDILSEAQAEGF